MSEYIITFILFSQFLGKLLSKEATYGCREFFNIKILNEKS